LNGEVRLFDEKLDQVSFCYKREIIESMNSCLLFLDYSTL
jgi:hypothetical protein